MTDTKPQRMKRDHLVNCRVDGPTKKAIDQAAVDADRSVSSWVALIIREALNKETKP